MRLITSLFCLAVLAISVDSQASPVANKVQTNAQLFIDAAQRIHSDGSSKVLKDAAQYLNPHIASEKGRGVAPGANLASSTFPSSDGGWTVTTSDGMVSNANAAGGSITTKFAQGGKTLYFTSPSSWPTDLGGAYNGKLNFMANPAEYTGSFVSATGFQSNPSGSSLYDVALVAQCGYAITYSGLFTATSTSTYSVTLNEDSGWIDSRTGRRPTMFDFLGTLSNLKSVQIRAYTYSGPGTGALYSASIQAGIKWNPCCTTDDTVDICANPGSPYYNPPQLRFYCAGSQAFVTRVTSVSPKFARQTGGATVTVYGENFGYPGSPATVRIGGLACQQTSYTTDTVATGNLGPINHKRLVCTTPVGRGFDHSVTVTAQSSSLASPYSVRENALRTRWENLGTDATSCSSDDTHGFQFGAHDFSLVTELTNLVPDSHIQVATDYNTGDVYTFGSIAANSFMTTLGKHISLGDTNRLPASGTIAAVTAFLLKSNKQGVPQWAAHITGVSAITPAGVQVDASTAPPSIYLAASIAYSGTALFCPGAYVANSLVGVTCNAAANGIKNRPDSSTPTDSGVKAVIAKYNGNGALVFASPISAAGTFQDLAISSFRPSTSQIINYQTQSDNPSAVPVKPYLKDNGGIFLAGTISGSGLVDFGYESQVYSNAPESAGGERSTITVAALTGFVTKYDDNGRVLWSRVFSADGNSAITAMATGSKVTDVSAMNDRVYVVGYQAGALYFQSCQFRTHSGGSGDTLSENRECAVSSTNYAALASQNAAGVFAVAYDASGVVQWIKNYAGSTGVTVAACAAVSSLKTARPLTGNTVAWNNLQTLLGRNQPIFGEPNGVGSEFREVGSAAGRWLYIVGSYSNTALVLNGNAAYAPIIAQGSFTTAKEPAYPIIDAGTTITLANTGAATRADAFLIKIDAVTGVTQWGSNYGAASWLVTSTDVAADPVTGNVFIAGTITTPSTGSLTSCNDNTAATNCGVDLFRMGSVRKIGCPQDPRPVLSSKQCPSGTVCAYGILNKERGLPYCNFVPLNTAVNKKSGFIAAINEVWTDEFGRTIALGYSSSTTPGVTNVAWFKALGNGHGHSSVSSNSVETQGSKLAIHDTDVIVTGTYSGVPGSVGSATVPGLQFPGVHALYQDNILLDDAEKTNEGIYSSSATGGFMAWLVD